MDEQISQLSDKAAIRVLSQMPETWSSERTNGPSLGPEQQEALIQWLGAPVTSSAVSEGDLARQALTLIAIDPLRRDAIMALAAETPSVAEQFDAGATIAIGAAVAIFRFRVGMIPTLLVSSLAGIALYVVGAIG